jgi:F-type H+-transporting ATPase subunit b
VSIQLPTQRTRIITLACFLALVLLAGLPSRTFAAPVQAEHTQPAAAEGEAHDSLTPTITKVANFAVVLGVLIYFLRSPLATHLATRGQQIRKDLVDAAALRKEGQDRLAAVRAQLAVLPAELEDMKRRGQEELAAERVRMAEMTALQRQQLLDRARRDVDLQFRLARRALLDHAAELSMSLARTRVEREITPADQDRLVDQYAAEVRS